MAIFKGFNTIGRIRPPYTLTDSELIKRDLLNEFYTRKGERLMRPGYGSIIWDLLMDPSTPDLDAQLKEDIKRIIDRDPRIEHLKTTLYVLDHTIRAEIDIKFVTTGGADKLYLEYKRNLLEGVN